MKRYSGLHDKLCTIENIEVAVIGMAKELILLNIMVNTLE